MRNFTLSLFLLLICATGILHAQRRPTTFTTAVETPQKTEFPNTHYDNGSYNYFRFGENGNGVPGVDRIIKSFIVDGRTYVRGEQGLSPFTHVFLNRIDNAVAVGNKATAFFEAEDNVIRADSTMYMSPTYVDTVEELINSYIFNRGADNVFANDGSTPNNVERIDLIFANGLTASSVAAMLQRSGILIMERGGNDPFKFAAIKSLNTDNTVRTLGSLKTATRDDSWGGTGVFFNSNVFQRRGDDTGKLKISQSIGSQQVFGTFITLSDLELNVNEVFYGISLFPADVTSIGTGANLVDLSDGFPINTGGGSDGGLDFMAGGGFFTLNNNLSGKIFHDAAPNGNNIDAHTGGADGSAITPLQLYLSLLDNVNNIISTVPINSSGNYTFFDVSDGTYSIVLHTNPNGSATPSLPSNWTFTGEGANGIKDNEGDGILTVTVPVSPNESLILNNFGLTVKMIANNDDLGTIKNNQPYTSTETVFENDTLNGNPVNPEDVTLSVDGNTVTTPVPFNDENGDPATGVTLNPDGTVSVEGGTTPGEYTITYSICDEDNNCDEATVTITVTESPIVASNDDLGTIKNNQPYTSTETVFENDTLNGNPVNPEDVTLSVDGNTLTTPVSFNDENGDPATGVALNPDGTVSVEEGTTPGEYTITYSICDEDNNCDEGTVTITVTESPIVASNDDLGTIKNNQPYTSTETVFENDTLNGNPVNPEDVTLSVDGNTVTTPVPFNDENGDPATGVILNPDGTVSVEGGTIPGEYTITYSICDEDNNCDEATVTITVTESPIVASNDDLGTIKNNQPYTSTETVFENDTLNSNPVNPQDVTLSVDGNTVTTPVPFNDENGDPTTGVTLNPDGTVSVEEGTTPGEYTITYSICDEDNNCDEATVTITVTESPIVASNEDLGTIKNNQPYTSTETVFENDTLNGNPVNPQDVTLSVDGNTVTTPVPFNDENGDPATGVILNPDGTVSVEEGTTPGEYTITYSICDEDNNCDEATVTITVTESPIVASNDDLGTIKNNQPYTSTETVFENDTLNGNPVNPEDVTLSVDGNTLTTPVSFNDENGDPATGVTLNPDGTVSVEEGTTPGEYTITYSICDEDNNCDEATVTITVTESPIVASNEDLGTIKNNQPYTSTETVFENDTLNGNPVNPEDVTLSVDGNTVTTPVAFNDENGDPATGVTLNPDGTVSVEGGTTPGEYTITYSICDEDNNCDEATVTITVTESPIVTSNDDLGTIKNNQPYTSTETVFENDTLNSNPVNPEDVTLSVDGNTVTTPVPFNDENGDPATGVTLNPDGTVSVEGGTTPGEYTITYSICDEDNNCDEATVTITVTESPIVASNDDLGTIKNNQPYTSTETVFENDTLNGNPVNPEDVTLSVDGNTVTTPVAFNDENGDPATGVTLNPDGTVSVEGGTTPGEYTITYSICDEDNNCDEATVTITVTESPIVASNDDFGTIKNNQPYTSTETVFENDTLNGNPVNPEDVTLSVDGNTVTTPVAFNDENGDPATGVTLNPDGTVSVEEGTTPGEYTITYSICDEDDNCDEATVTITVTEEEIFDLALSMQVKPGQNSVFKVGDTVTFVITVDNEGTIDASNINIVDYIPEGFELNDTNWLEEDGKASLVNPITAIAAGQSSSVEISFTVVSVPNTSIVNKAEISTADGGTDVDSTPNNNIDGEDDTDTSTIQTCQSGKCFSVKTTRIK